MEIDSTELDLYEICVVRSMFRYCNKSIGPRGFDMGRSTTKDKPIFNGNMNARFGNQHLLHLGGSQSSNSERRSDNSRDFPIQMFRLNANG